MGLLRVILFWVGMGVSSVFAQGEVGSFSRWREEDLWVSLHDQFLLGEELLFRFDQSLQQGKTVPAMILEPAKDGMVYARLQAIREFREQIEAELESRMLLFFSVEDSSSGGGGFESWIRKRAEGFRKKADIRKLTFDFSLSSLLEHAKKFDQARGFGLESLSRAGWLEEYRNWRSRFRSQGGRASLRSGIRESLESSAKLIQESWRVAREEEAGSGTHSPDLRIFPSSGRSGNITGNSFPEGTWALTFDDGPGPLTPGVLRNLKSHGLKASFFVLTSLLEKSAEIASFSRQAIQDGHDVVSHSYRHLKIPGLPQSEQKQEIEDALQGFEAILGFRPDLFRLPYGAGVSDPVVRENLVKSCVVHVFWNVDTLDWQDRDPSSILTRTLRQMNQLGRGVILFHDIHAQSVIASERLMSHLNASGLRAITLSDFIRGENGGAKSDCKLGWGKPAGGD